VNHRIEAPESIHLCCYVAGLRETGEIAKHNALGSRNGRHGLLAALFISRMKNDLVSLLHQKASGHLPKAVRGSGNENSCHLFDLDVVIYIFIFCFKPFL
jgi:hypothetical protein